MDLTTYLSELDGNYRLFDVGRRIRKLDKKQFQQVENLEIPYPSPYLHHAWLALYISQPNQPENETLWFLKWPLDEQGYVIPYVRDDLLSRLIQLSKQPLQMSDTELEDPLKDNPFSFKPDDVRRANLHALIQASQRRKPSHHFDPVVSYLQAANLNGALLENWQTLGIQGIADFSARLSNYKQTLKACIAHMPSEPYLAFAQCLEHHEIPHEISEQAFERLNRDLTTPNTDVAIEASMRIIGASKNEGLRIQAWEAWIASDYRLNLQILLVFATRNYDDLAFIPQHIPVFLENLASLDNTYATFTKVMNDLLFLPGTRGLLLNALRSESRPDVVAQAMHVLMNQQGQA